MTDKTPMIADKFEIVTAGDGPALAAAHIEGPVMGWAIDGNKKEPVRPGDTVMSRSGQQLFPDMR